MEEFCMSATNMRCCMVGPPHRCVQTLAPAASARVWRVRVWVWVLLWVAGGQQERSGPRRTWSWWWVVKKQARSVSVLCRETGISCDGLFDLCLSWDVAEVVARCKILGACCRCCCCCGEWRLCGNCRKRVIFPAAFRWAALFERATGLVCDLANVGAEGIGANAYLLYVEAEVEACCLICAGDPIIGVGS